MSIAGVLLSLKHDFSIYHFKVEKPHSVALNHEVQFRAVYGQNAPDDFM